MKILAISGSLRKASFNTALLKAAESIADQQWHYASIGDIPLYNQELDGDSKPEAAQRFIDAVDSADALVIACPEYNYGMTGALKNALDWASRPAFKSPLAHKPVLIMGASMSAYGGARAQGQLKQVLLGTLSRIYPAPEFALGQAQDKFTDGKLTDGETRKKLQRLMQDFHQWLKQ